MKKSKKKTVKNKAPVAAGALKAGRIFRISELVPEMMDSYPFTKYWTRAQRESFASKWRDRNNNKLSTVR